MATQTGPRKIITKKTDDTLIDIKKVENSAEVFFEKYKNLLSYGVMALAVVFGGY